MVGHFLRFFHDIFILFFFIFNSFNILFELRRNFYIFSFGLSFFHFPFQMFPLSSPFSDETFTVLFLDFYSFYCNLSITFTNVFPMNFFHSSTQLLNISLKVFQFSFIAIMFTHFFYSCNSYAFFSHIQKYYFKILQL